MMLDFSLSDVYSISPDQLNGATTLSITTFSIITLSINGLYVTLNINNTQHNYALPLC